MMRFGLGRRARLVVVLAGALTVGAMGVALGSIPSSDGTFAGCVGTNGRLRVIDADAGGTCTTGEQAITWNQQGPPGPAGPGAVALYYNNGRPPLTASAPAPHTIATIGPLTFTATCWRNSADNTVNDTLGVSSSSPFDLDEVLGGRSDDTGAYTSAPADGNGLGSARVDTTIAAIGHFFRVFASPSILTVPSGAAQPDTYSITAYLFTDARSKSRRCTIKGNVMPAN